MEKGVEPVDMKTFREVNIKGSLISRMVLICLSNIISLRVALLPPYSLLSTLMRVQCFVLFRVGDCIFGIA